MTVVGRYELLEPIGHGGMAVVYLAKQLGLDRLVALKELRVAHVPDDPMMAERFLREARMAGSLNHANIVQVIEHFEHEGTPYIAMEYLKRGSLRPLVGRLTHGQVIGVMQGVLAALEHAEQLRVVHRDLKPENLLVGDQGQIKVADFGIAKALTNATMGLTAANTALGTPAYMSPEQGMAKEVGPFTDLYSLGVIAYELLVGRVPFEQTDTPLAVLLKHCTEEIPPAYTVNPEVARPLSDWIDRLLVKDPARRTGSAATAWEELDDIALELFGPRWQRAAKLPASSELPPVISAQGPEPASPAQTSGYISVPLPRRGRDETPFDEPPEPRAAPQTPPQAAPSPPAAPATPPAAPMTRDPPIEPPAIIPLSGDSRTVAPEPVRPEPVQPEPVAAGEPDDGGGGARRLLPLLALLAVAVIALGAAATMLLGGGDDGDGGGGGGARAGANPGGATDKAPPVRIGGLYSLSGKSKDAGAESVRGVEFAMDYLNTDRTPDLGLAMKAGAGLPALRGAKLKLVKRDAKGRCGAEAAFDHLVDKDRVAAVIGAYESTVTLRGIVAAQRRHVPLVNDTSTAQGLTDDADPGETLTPCKKNVVVADPTPSPWFARVGPNDSQFAELYGRFLEDQRDKGHPVRKVAVLYEKNDSYGENGLAATTAMAKRRGITVEAYPYDSNLATGSAGSECPLGKLVDALDTQVSAIAKSKPDAVFALSYLPDAVTTVQVMERQHYRPPALLAYGGGYADPLFVKQARIANPKCKLPAADPSGIISRAAFSTYKNETARRASDLYEQRYHKPMSDIAARSFTATLALAQAIDKARSRNPRKIRAAVRRLRVPDAQTIVPGGIAFDRNGQNEQAGGVLQQLLGDTSKVVFPKALAEADAVWPLADAP